MIVQKNREEFLSEIDCAYADAKRRGEDFDLSQFSLTEEEKKQIEENWLYAKMFIDAGRNSPKLFKREVALIAQFKKEKHQ